MWLKIQLSKLISISSLLIRGSKPSIIHNATVESERLHFPTHANIIAGSMHQLHHLSCHPDELTNGSCTVVNIVIES